jgi:1,3-beta-glucanosyltransferase GAS3
VCQRDAAVLQRLGANAIRVYNLDPEVDHTDCASIFNAAGIYLIIDVNSPLPHESLNRVDPQSTYHEDYLGRTFSVVSAFMNFDNTLAFFSGNEVINEESAPEAPMYMRAVTRDIKQYIDKWAPREIPVGYSAADVRPLLLGTFGYLGCNLANDTASRMDFFGLNSYAWCGESDMETAEYDVLIEELGNTTIPVFMSEYGCNIPDVRPFTEVGAIYSEPMMGVFSGGVVYEYSQEENDYGLVEIDDNGDLELFEDYINLLDEFNNIDLEALTATNRTAMDRRAPECSLDLLNGANFTASFDIPAQPSEIADLIENGVSGTFPEGLVEWTETAVGHTVSGPDGAELSDLQLNILAADASNLPGGEPIATGERVDIGEGDNGVGDSQSGGESGSDSGSGDESAAARIGGAQLTVTAMAAVGVAMFML